MKRKILFLTLTLLLIPVAFLFAQTVDTTGTANITNYTFLQGVSTVDNGTMEFFELMRQKLFNNGTLFVSDASALSALFMIIFFAIKSYEMMSGDKQFEVMPLLRPFGLVLILLYWLPFCGAVRVPTEIIASTTKASWQATQTNVDNLRIERAKLMLKVADALYNQQTDTEVAAKEADNWWDKAVDWTSSALQAGVNTVVKPIMEMRARFSITIQLFFTQMLEIMAVWLLRSGIALLMMIQLIYSNVLVILGPFAVAASVLPAFRDSFTTWIARYVAVNLYVGVGYLVMWLCCQMQETALQMEIERYNDIFATGTDTAKLLALSTNGILSFGLVIVAFVVSAAAMLTVPSISTWIISTSGISSAAAAAGRNAMAITGGGSKAVGSFMPKQAP
ncbi:MAG: plasmid transfer protein [Sphingobacteriaceae bacterium]|nr:MAG: plasmid transfer protein [Sphingobacteriaceae bacterium]